MSTPAPHDFRYGDPPYRHLETWPRFCVNCRRWLDYDMARSPCPAGPGSVRTGPRAAEIPFGNTDILRGHLPASPPEGRDRPVLVDLAPDAVQGRDPIATDLGPGAPGIQVVEVTDTQTPPDPPSPG